MKLSKAQQQLLADLAGGACIVTVPQFNKPPRYRVNLCDDPRGVLYITLEAMESLGYIKWSYRSRTFVITDEGRAIVEAQNITE